MPRYAALLRGVMPMNATMPAIKAAFEAAGFTAVRTVLASGNVLFTAAAAAEATLVRRAEAALVRGLGRDFPVIVRPVAALHELLAADPFAPFRLPADAKRVVTFLRSAPKGALPLPIELDGARILAVRGREAFTAYLPSPKGPVFMKLIETTFGKEVTTRTWETVARIARLG